MRFQHRTDRERSAFGARLRQNLSYDRVVRVAKHQHELDQFHLERMVSGGAGPVEFAERRLPQPTRVADVVFAGPCRIEVDELVQPVDEVAENLQGVVGDRSLNARDDFDQRTDLVAVARFLNELQGALAKLVVSVQQ